MWSDDPKPYSYTYTEKKCAEQKIGYGADIAIILKGQNAQSTRSTTDNANANASKQGNPEQPNWCDLASQESMAKSTYWMNKAAWAGIFLSVVGVWLIWRTLVASRQTLREAGKATEAAIETIDVTREIGEAQTRAYLSISWVNAVYSPSAEGDVMHWRIGFQLANSGQTPARKIQYRADIVTEGSETIGEIHTLPDISGGYVDPDPLQAEINQDRVVFENGLVDELRYDLKVKITFWFIDVFKNPQVEPIHFGGVKNFAQGPHGGIGLRCIVVDEERSD